MRFLSGKEEALAKKYLIKAGKIAINSSCLRARCGSVIVKNDKIIGIGFNSPAKELESQRKCLEDRKKFHERVTDKTCCIHAEQRAIMNALRKNPDKIKGSRLYFMRVDKDGKITKAGKPYCTICSKMSLDSGIKEFVLWHEKGICVYDTEEYNLLSYDYQE
jgi:deoxycytidylate deaminase